MKENLVIIGASGHGKVVADIALATKQYTNIVFLDDNPNTKHCLNYPISGKSSDFKQYIESSDFIIAIGNSAVREKLAKQLQDNNATFATLIHPRAVVSSYATIEEGTVVMAGAVINPDVKIGRHCIVNTSASIDHDCIIEEFAHVSVGAHVAGMVHVHSHTWIGAGAIIINNVSITSNCMIGAGAVVLKDIIESGTYVGVPVRKI